MSSFLTMSKNLNCLQLLIVLIEIFSHTQIPLTFSTQSVYGITKAKAERRGSSELLIHRGGGYS